MSEAARKLYVAEPPPPFRVLPPVVVDCSVLSAVLFEEDARDAAVERLSGRALHAPTLIDHELASVALKKQQRGWASDAIRMALASYREQPIVLHRVDLAAQCALAERYGLSAYDAAYLQLAADLKTQLATFDRKLGEAAQAHLGSLER